MAMRIWQLLCAAMVAAVLAAAPARAQSCSDGNECTGSGTCQNGECLAGAPVGTPTDTPLTPAATSTATPTQTGTDTPGGPTVTQTSTPTITDTVPPTDTVTPGGATPTDSPTAVAT
ncbi:MAG TPA: hypothetical protein VL049_17175, partial [Candidatus Dormibacteraeota bacterium]|nr:hypothetical protein [Candidatus Dormibacteraeota bacterium]